MSTTATDMLTWRGVVCLSPCCSRSRVLCKNGRTHCDAAWGKTCVDPWCAIWKYIWAPSIEYYRMSKNGGIAGIAGQLVESKVILSVVRSADERPPPATAFQLRQQHTTTLKPYIHTYYTYVKCYSAQYT